MKLKLMLLALPSIMWAASCSDDDGGKDSPTPDRPTEVRHTQGKSPKRGVGYSFQLPAVDMLLLSDGISWFYNWSPKTSDEVAAEAGRYGVRFVPMAWNDRYDTAAISNTVSIYGDKYLLAFNEPNLTDQARMTPSEAAKYWPALKAFAQARGLQIVSPAMNYGTLPGYSDPVKWLDEFFAQPGVSVDDICAIALHSYMNSASAVKGYLDKFVKYGKPLWLTEFCAWDGGVKNAAAQIAYMSEVLPYLEENPLVERYAWFIPRYKTGEPYMQLLEGSGLTEAGKVYVNASTADKDAYALPGQKWRAAHYRSSNASEGVEASQPFSAAPRLRSATDAEAYGEIEVSSFSTNKWLEYGLDATSATSTIKLRVNTLTATELTVTVDGREVAADNISTGGEWQTVELPAEASKGCHVVRLSVVKGSMSLGWIIFE